MLILKYFFLFHLSNSLGLKTPGTLKTPTTKQKKYTQLLEDRNINLVVAHGPAGTGKSWLACKVAIEELKSNHIKKIVLTRPVVPVEDENLGFLPGTIDEKMNPWIQPLYDIFIDEKSKSELNSLLKSGQIEIVPIGFMRGRTFADTFVIADEMQNSSPTQMKMILTRMGENSKIVVNGDISQCDLKIEENGLKNFISVVNKHYENLYEMYNNKIGMVEFDIKDVKRSEFVQNILEIYEK